MSSAGAIRLFPPSSRGLASSRKGMDVSITTTFPSVLQVPSAIFQKDTQVSQGGEPERFSLERRWRASATPTKCPACRLCPSSVQVRPVFLQPSSATLSLYVCPSIGSMFLQRETVHEQEASLERMDVTEERVGLYADAI